MSDLIRIKYRTEVVISVDDLLGKWKEFESDKVPPEFEDEVEEAEWRYEQEKETKQELEFAEAFKEIGEKENGQVLTYTFNKKIIRYERVLYNSEDEFILIEPKTGVMSRFYIYKDEPRVNKMFLYPQSDEWRIHNKISVDKTNIKNILGYDCYKMVIEHKAVNEKEDWVNDNIYELYVTEELNLPAPLLINIWQPITSVCALEIRNEKAPNTYQIERAFEIEKGINPDEVELPKIFEKLKTDES